MTSVQLSANSLDHRPPGLNQWCQLQRLVFVKLGNLFELRNLLLHQWKVSNRPHPCPRHINVAVQGLAAENDAAVGFGWCHDGNMPCLC